MESISFSEFAKTLKPFVAPGLSQGEFVQDLFIHISKLEGNENPIFNKADATLSQYYSGRMSINGLVSGAFPQSLDVAAFVEWIEDNIDIRRQEKLFEKLRDKLPSGAECDFPENCAKLFREIIEEASARSGTRNRKQKELPLSLDYSNESEDAQLVAECNNRCLLCGKRLKHKAKVAIIPALASNEEISMVRSIAYDRFGCEVPAKFDVDSPDNKALLDLECAASYENESTIEKQASLLARKLKAKRSYDVQLAVDEIELEQALGSIIGSMDRLVDKEAVEKLRYKPIKVKNKIPDEDFLLKNRVVSNVDRYYGFIATELEERSAHGELDPDELSMSMKRCFKKLDSLGEGYEAIYRRMTEWVSESTGCENRSACEVVISFFIQSCEIFNEIEGDRDEASE